MDYNLYDDPCIKDFLNNRDLQPSTIRSYMHHIRLYCTHINLTPSQFIEEAEQQEHDRIMMRRRNIKSHLLSFKEFLQSQNYSPQNISVIMTVIRSFYREFEIDIPHIVVRKKEVSRQKLSDVPTIEHLRLVMKHCNPKYRAIISLMLSSGMGASEVLSLTYSDFLKSIETYLNGSTDIGVIPDILGRNDTLIIGTWYVTRKKTSMDYVTFSSPESIEYIIEYLLSSPVKNKNNNLFRTARHQQTPLTYNAFKNYFARLNEVCNFGRYGRQNFFRSHSLRKLFASTLFKHKISKLNVDWFLGHRIDPISESYFKTDIESLKQEYSTVVQYLTIADVEVQVLQSEDKKKLHSMEKEMEEMKEQVRLLQELQK